MADRPVRIGGASGAWGDSPTGIHQLVEAGVDYLVMDYLAEVSMSLLARARIKNPDTGYPPDFVDYVAGVLPEIAGGGIKVISNGGGVNPRGAASALRQACVTAGVDLRVAVVEGDDVLPMLDRLDPATLRIDPPHDELPERLLTANAYLGAIPITAALAAGADLVVTGRCADSALALAALVHEFGWSAADYDALAAGSLVGHLLECGPQVTGGTFTDWHLVPGWDRIGYPIAECDPDGAFVVTKPADTGGLVVPGCVAEQVLYEIADPTAYLLPDVTADFSQVRLEQAGTDRVRVTGASGRPPTPDHKVSATYQDGWRAVASVSIVGPQAATKAERTAEALLARARRLFADAGFGEFAGTHVDVIGAESSYGDQAASRDTREVLLRLVVDHDNADALRLFARELGSVGLSMAPGTTGLLGGRPRPTAVVRLCTFYVDKSALPAPVVTVDDHEPTSVEVRPIVAPPDGVGQAHGGGPDATDDPRDADPSDASLVRAPLRDLAYARSGDKGDSANIAIIARRPEYIDVLRWQVTPERLKAHFADRIDGDVVRYDVPGINAFNFVLTGALGGGGMASRRLDPQGKAYGQIALEMFVTVPSALVSGQGPPSVSGLVEKTISDDTARHP